MGRFSRHARPYRPRDGIRVMVINGDDLARVPSPNRRGAVTIPRRERVYNAAKPREDTHQMHHVTRTVILLLLFALPFGFAAAQEGNTDTGTLLSPEQLTSTGSAGPASYYLDGIAYHPQAWNNCGPATLTMGLSYFGYTADQFPAANFLKPNTEDKNVSPWQMAEFVNTQVAGNTQALVRHGGTQAMLRTLIANDFPVIIEAGYDPPPHTLGWMGHYLLVRGYDDVRQVYVTNDSYDGENLEYSYAEVADKWQHFNYVYIVLYDYARQEELMALLGGEYADEQVSYLTALEIARAEATADPTDPFAWFNMGTNFVALGDYASAAAAYDQARTHGLPWRMLWYQFGMFEAYNGVGRYNDVIALAQQNLNDGGGQYVEETFYYAGVAREGLGETQRALVNYNSALEFNPNFSPAREARDALLAAQNS